MKFTVIKPLNQIVPELTPEIKKSFMNVGRSICPEFKIPDEIKETVLNLCLYFLGLESKLDSNRGIYLHGTYGIGKTTLLATIRKWLASDMFPIKGNGFISTSIEEIIDIYKREGNIERFMLNREDYNPGPRHLLINEYGKDIKDKIYGTEVNQIINSLLMRRYEIYQNHTKLTHVTSNFEPSESFGSNDPAIYDRIKEMFNVIELKGESFRKQEI